MAAIGLGWVAMHRHLPAMDRNKLFHVLGVIDRHEGRAETVARERRYRHYGQAARMTDIPWLDEVDAVTVATPPMSHFALVKEALAANKHVLTEKPFTMTVDQAEELVTLAHRMGRSLGIVHNFQFSRSARALQLDLAHDRIGAIRSVGAIQFSNPRRRLPSWF